eukprot:s998_g7.t1
MSEPKHAKIVERDEDMPREGVASATKAAESLVQDGDESALQATEAAEGVTQEVETVVPDEELEEPPEGPSAASEAGMAEQEATAELTTEEKIQTILAAFDANEDGCLNFEESNELQQFADGDVLDPTVFKIICGELRCSRRGLGAKELRSCYDRFGTLDRDFKAALRKIQSDDAGGKVSGHRTGPEGSNNWSMMGLFILVRPMKGARFVKMECLLPGNGPLLKAVEAACCACARQRSGREKPWGHEAEVLGKPNPAYAQLIAEWHGLDLRRTVMVGDRLDTDIEMGRRAGMLSLHVLTGVDDLTQIDAKGIVPDFVLPSVGHLWTQRVPIIDESTGSLEDLHNLKYSRTRWRARGGLDPTDPLDKALASALHRLDTLTAARLEVQKLGAGRYQIEGRAVLLRKSSGASPRKQKQSLVVYEEKD